MKHWNEAYRHIAILLNDLYLTNRNNSARILLQKLRSHPTYLKENNWLRQAIEKHNMEGIDPIQLFASFNNSSSSHQSRIKRINLLLNALESEEIVQNTKSFFVGCPTPMVTKMINTRKENFQNQIWGVFSSIVSNGFSGLTPAHFQRIGSWFGINIPSFTIFLFWIDSDHFLPLDKNTRSFVAGIGMMDKMPNSYKEYISLCELNTESGIYREIVKLAYENIHLKQQNLKISKKTNDFLQQFSTQKEREENLGAILQNFKIVAIRPIKKTESSNNLKPKQNYSFYHECFDFKKDDDEISYRKGVEDQLFGNEKMDVSISAIVGKNGSGKSTLTELIFQAINLLSLKKVKTKNKLIPELAYLDFFFKTDTLYKLIIRGESVKINRYIFDPKSSIYTIEKNKNGKPQNFLEDFDLGSFFYTVALNYSLYGLNEKIIGDWISPLFHKNDSYQVPIVLNPKRNKGNIEINTEEYLAKSRMLANVLEPERMDFEKGIAYELVPNKIPLEINISLDKDKIQRKKEKYNAGIEMIETYVSKTLKRLNIIVPTDRPFLAEVKEYIYYKLVSICMIYSDSYGTFRTINKDGTFKSFLEFTKYIDAIFTDYSHITFKIRQALNYLQYGHISFEGNKAKMLIVELSDRINAIKKGISEDESKNNDRIPRTIELIPPSIFKTDLVFTSGSSFERLSSGEKQHIFVLNTIAYHIYNIDSVRESDDLLKYEYVNVLLDEIELYFHPDMQRNFIKDLLNTVNQIELENISAFNFIFITHSPFILSDIPSSNILRLNNGEPKPEENQTFGANIHQLLHNEFFLENGFIGEFAKEKINEVVDYLRIIKWQHNIKLIQKRVLEEEDGGAKEDLEIQLEILRLEKSRIKKLNEPLTIDRCKKVIDIVGEPVLQESLLSLYNEVLTLNREQG